MKTPTAADFRNAFAPLAGEDDALRPAELLDRGPTSVIELEEYISLLANLQREVLAENALRSAMEEELWLLRQSNEQLSSCLAAQEGLPASLEKQLKNDHLEMLLHPTLDSFPGQGPEVTLAKDEGKNIALAAQNSSTLLASSPRENAATHNKYGKAPVPSKRGKLALHPNRRAPHPSTASTGHAANRAALSPYAAVLPITDLEVACAADAAPEEFFAEEDAMAKKLTRK